MTYLQLHKEQIKEHVKEINDAIAIGLEKRPATLGLHASACAISILEAYLHALGKISVGSMIKHEWFKPPKAGQKIAPLAERKIGADFPRKDEIFSLMYAIEEHRNKLIYGKPTKTAMDAVL
ncbi:hypothetical protein HYY71_05815 [Candidatus Woesearchaeota archaeon]|nr:hypothetical protein [Candidatus Woesearchaeota archaeon]